MKVEDKPWKETRHGKVIRTRIVGATESEVKFYLDRYRREYPWAGYMTEVVRGPVPLHRRGWEVIVERSESCE